MPRRPLVTDATVVATTVHEDQVVEGGGIPETTHDFRLDLVVTPERVITCRRGRRRHAPPGIRWDELTDEMVASIPLVGRLRDRAGR